MEIEEWIRSSSANSMEGSGWSIIRFIGFMILWNIVDALFDAIFKRVLKK